MKFHYSKILQQQQQQKEKEEEEEEAVETWAKKKG